MSQQEEKTLEQSLCYRMVMEQSMVMSVSHSLGRTTLNARKRKSPTDSNSPSINDRSSITTGLIRRRAETEAAKTKFSMQ